MRLFLTLWGIMFVAFAGINMAILSYAYGGIPEFEAYMKVLGLTVVGSFALAGIIGAIAGISGIIEVIESPQTKKKEAS